MTKREKDVKEKTKGCDRIALIKMIAKLEHQLEIKENVVEMQAEALNSKLSEVVSKQTVSSMLVDASKEYERLKRDDRKGLSSLKYIVIGDPLEDNEGTFNILCDTVNTQYIVGKYKTEERAKEILQEMVNTYKGYNDNKIYEMPEE